MYYEQKLSTGTILKVYHLGNVLDTVSPVRVEEALNEIKSNIGAYVVPEVFTNLVIEIWDDNRPDNPVNSCRLPDSQCFEGQKYAGLGSKNFIQLRYCTTRQLSLGQDPVSYLANLIGHEFGHHYASYCGFTDSKTSNLFQKWWNSNRRLYTTPETPSGELFAEDFRLLLGTKECRQLKRGNYLQGDQIWGLRDVMLLWSFFTNHCEKIVPRLWNIPFSKIVLDDYQIFTKSEDIFSIKYSNIYFVNLFRQCYLLNRNGLYLFDNLIYKF